MENKRVYFNSKMKSPIEVAVYIEANKILKKDIISITWDGSEWLFCLFHY
jgi:hypothetical protein